jgi:hypothetical protein
LFATFLSALVLVEFLRCARRLVVHDKARYSSIRVKLGAADEFAGFSNIVMRFVERRLEFAQV